MITLADLSLDKVVLDDNGQPDDFINLRPGDPIRYQISVINLGPSVARNVVVTDVLPAEVTLVGTTGCAEDPSGIPDCSLGDLNVNQSISYLVDVTLNPDARGPVENTATADSDTDDPVDENNTEVNVGVGVIREVPMNQWWTLLLMATMLWLITARVRRRS